MARKSLVDLDPNLRSAVDEFQAVSLVKFEMARDAYNMQDAETKAAIDRIHGTLQQHATGYINVVVGKTVYPVRINSEYLGYNLLYLAVEIVKDLAFTGIRIAKFKVPPLTCVACGDPIEAGKRG